VTKATQYAKQTLLISLVSQLLLGALLKAEYLHIAVATDPFESRIV